MSRKKNVPQERPPQATVPLVQLRREIVVKLLLNGVSVLELSGDEFGGLASAIQQAQQQGWFAQ